MIRHRQITKLNPKLVEKKLQEFFNEDNTEEDITTTKLHGIAGVYTHMKKGWSHIEQV